MPSKPFPYRKRIIDTLQIVRVVYGRELRRRIGLHRGATAVWVAKQMVKEGALESSPVEKIRGTNLKIRFFWLPGTDQFTVDTVKEYKKHLLFDHFRYSSYQEVFGPRLAIASLKELANAGFLPLDVDTIKGPIKVWAGPHKEWLHDEVPVGRGDIDVIALDNEANLWLGEVKMRSDAVIITRVEHFVSVARSFRMRIFNSKGVDYPLRLFFLAPVATHSAQDWCEEHQVALVECKKAYYPSKSPKRPFLRDFYEEYRKVMGVPNLEIVSYPSPSDLPIPEVSKAMKEKLKGFGGKI